MDNDQLYRRVLELRATRAPFAICTVTASRGSAPRKPGTKMLVHADGRIEGTVGGGAIELKVVQRACDAIASGRPETLVQHLTHDLGMCCGGGMTVFIEPQTIKPRLYLFGCGHVGRPTASLAAACGFDVIAIDGREDLARSDRFAAEVDVRCAEPDDVFPELAFDDDHTFVVVVTHDHALDEAIVAEVMRRSFRFLGCIGSQRKALKFRDRLAARGLDEATIARMQTPMGIDIGAQTPDEIAVSVVAELVRIRRDAAP